MMTIFAETSSHANLSHHNAYILFYMTLNTKGEVRVLPG